MDEYVDNLTLSELRQAAWLEAHCTVSTCRPVCTLSRLHCSAIIHCILYAYIICYLESTSSAKKDRRLMRSRSAIIYTGQRLTSEGMCMGLGIR